MMILEATLDRFRMQLTGRGDIAAEAVNCVGTVTDTSELAAGIVGSGMAVISLTGIPRYIILFS